MYSSEKGTGRRFVSFLQYSGKYTDSRHNQPNIKDFIVVAFCCVLTSALSVSGTHFFQKNIYIFISKAYERYGLDARFQNTALAI